MNKPLVIHWFRRDLRLSDNPALYQAAAHGKDIEAEVFPIYILQDQPSGPDDSDYSQSIGSVSRWGLYHSLRALDDSLGRKLSVYKGDPLSILSHLIDRYPVKAIYWNRRYEPAHIACDRAIKESLQVPIHSYNGSLLWEPWTIKNGSNEPYKVFTPFYRKGCLNAPPPRQPLPAPDPIEFFSDAENNQTIDQLGLLPKIRWDTKLAPHWSMGEESAHNRLEIFLNQGLGNYKEGRNFPAKPFTSRLSPYLHFGNISPNQAWYAARSVGDNPDIDCFCSELGWREFSYSQLFHHPGLPHENWQKKFDRFPWMQPDNDPRKAALKAWQTGQTGIPLVDAGMRELWQTGYMHNRVRMVTGSFLVKNLLLHWWHGAKWFWDCLLDADMANNSAGWQWVAGSGCDAAPYFRIFNPVTQGQRFDPDGDYTRSFVPELSRLPTRYLFDPWTAPADILKKAGVILGETYPVPCVDLALSRQQALKALEATRSIQAVPESP